jgi:ABC-type uncharacterized transport system ATPase component
LHGQQVTDNALWTVALKPRVHQRTVVEIGQQVVRQVGEQHEPFLGQKAPLPSGGQAQAVLVVAELLDFGSATAVIERYLFNKSG